MFSLYFVVVTCLEQAFTTCHQHLVLNNFFLMSWFIRGWKLLSVRVCIAVQNTNCSLWKVLNTFLCETHYALYSFHVVCSEMFINAVKLILHFIRCSDISCDVTVTFKVVKLKYLACRMVNTLLQGFPLSSIFDLGKYPLIVIESNSNIHLLVHS